MVLQARIELATSPLPRECSTTELLQRRCERLIRRIGAGTQAQYGPCLGLRLVRDMDSKATHEPGAREKADSREDRLKAALKANIARRKAQARQRRAQSSDNNNDKSEA